MSQSVVCRQKTKEATRDRGHMALTDTRIKGLDTPAKKMQVADGGGLSLDLHPSGKKSWLYRYRLNGKYGRVSLGRYPDLSLKAARKKRDEMAGQVATDHDPARRKRGDRLGYAPDSTVEEFGERYYAEQVVTTWKSPIHIRRYLDNDVFPALGRKPLSSVTAIDVQAIVYRKRDQGRIPAAMQLRGVVKRMFEYAIELQLVTVNPAAMVATRYIGRTRSRSRVLTPPELRLYLRTVYASNMRRQFKLALHLILLTLSRKSELLLARWKDVDLEAAEWVVPIENAKNTKAHMVYLSAQAVRIFRDLRALA